MIFFLHLFHILGQMKLFLSAESSSSSMEMNKFQLLQMDPATLYVTVDIV